MKRNALVALLAALIACGGNDKPDPASRTFTYGAALTPTATESAAIAAGEASTSDGAALQADVATDPATAGSSIMALPDRMAAEAWSSSTLALQGSSTARTVASLGGPAAVMTTGFDNPACVTIVPGASITYTGCTVTLDTAVIKVGGKIALTGATLGWDLATQMTDANASYSMTIDVHATGALTFGATSVTGRARSDTRASVTSSGATMVAAYTTLADLDLQFARDPFCVTGGTLELRRVWTERPMGMSATGPYADQGLRFTWQGCGSVLVQHSL